MLDVREIKTQAEEWINQGKLLNLIEARDVVYRIILVRSNVFKETLLKRRDRNGSSDGYPDSFVTFARGLPMPRYVWLVEVSYSDDWDPEDRDSPPVIADFVFDSTMTAIMRLDYLLLHFTFQGRSWHGRSMGTTCDFCTAQIRHFMHIRHFQTFRDPNNTTTSYNHAPRF